jgi:hypothetical protein
MTQTKVSREDRSIFVGTALGPLCAHWCHWPTLRVEGREQQRKSYEHLGHCSVGGVRYQTSDQLQRECFASYQIRSMLIPLAKTYLVL